MEKLIKGVNSIDIIAVGAGGLLTYLIGGWTALMGILLTVQVIDIVTGVMKGKRAEDIGSKSFLAGIKKKVGMWILIILANMIDKTAFGGTPVAVTGVLGFLIAGEGISIVENITVIGVNVPEFITRYLSQIKEKAEDTDNSKGELGDK